MLCKNHDCTIPVIVQFSLVKHSVSLSYYDYEMTDEMRLFLSADVQSSGFNLMLSTYCFSGIFGDYFALTGLKSRLLHSKRMN